MTSRVPKPPCKDCTDRNEQCHGTCERYLKWKKMREEIINQSLPQYRAECAAEHFMNGKRSRFRAFGKTGRKK